MAGRIKYDINAEWDDPYEHLEDRRKTDRCVENVTIKIAVQVENHADPLVGQGLVLNISQTGMLCRTKHRLTVGQDIQLSIPTQGYSGTEPLPRKFIGSAKVARVITVDDTVQNVGLEFGSALSDNMSFAIFIETLQAISSMKAAQ